MNISCQVRLRTMSTHSQTRKDQHPTAGYSIWKLLHVVVPGEPSSRTIERSKRGVLTCRDCGENCIAARPTPEGEARNGMLVIEDTVWKAVPEYYRRIDRCLRRIGQPQLPYGSSILKLSSWMGGDRDGNPNVTWHTTKQVVTLLRWRIVELYYREAERRESCVAV